MKVEIQTYLVEKSDGESVFKIEMINNDCESWLNFKCAIEIDYNKHPGMKKSIAKLISNETSPETEMSIIQQILAQVTTIEGIQKCKILENPDQEREHIENRYNKFLTYLALQNGIRQFEPFSALKNRYYFREFVHKLTPHLPILMEINRNQFEELITGHSELEEEYIRYFSTDASFYLISANHEHVGYKFIIMKNAGIDLFFFTRHLN